MTKKIILAYSGGLDTSFLIPYLQKTHGAEIHCVTVDTGGLTPERKREIEKRARALGAADISVLDARASYFSDVLSYLIKGNVLRGGVYPLCVGAERVIQARELVQIAKEKGATIIAHGSTAAGNDQVRFEVYLRVLAPEITILAPVRDEGFKREQEITYLREAGFDFPSHNVRFSINEGLWGKTMGSRDIQDPGRAVPPEAYDSGAGSKGAPPPETARIEFDRGVPVRLNDKASSPVQLVETLNARAGEFEIGRGVHLGNTIMGIKGRVAFEAPAATVLLDAHRELEKLVLTKWESFWKAQLGNFYGDMLHEGQYFDPVMREIEAFVDRSQERVSGVVTLRLETGRALVESCVSPYSLVSAAAGVYGEEASLWNGSEARGFSRIAAIPALLWHQAGGKK